MLVAIILLAVPLTAGAALYAFWQLGKALDEDESRPPVQYLDNDEFSGASPSSLRLGVKTLHHLAWTGGRWASGS